MAVVKHAIEEDESVHLIDVYFEVEKSIFRVPRRHFEESAMFRAIFRLPVAKNAIPDGVSKDHPLRLEGVSKDEFKQLLWFMMMNPSLLEPNMAEYTAVLKLSTMWELERTRDVVIRNMSAFHINPLERIKLARQYFVKGWLLSSLNEYARHGESITPEDVDLLGLDSILKIVQLRETATGSMSGLNHNYTAALRKAFQDEIRQAKTFDSQEATGLMEFQDDDIFYLSDVYFLVENCLFRTRRQFFEVSPIFRDMFSLPIAENALPDGCSTMQPLRLNGIRKADFKQFIKFLNMGFGQETTFSLPEWTSILKLSTMWEFTKIRRFVVDKLSKLPISIIEKIVLARDYHISSWLLPALDEYTRQAQPITVGDVDRLGLDFILRVIQVRERERWVLGGPEIERRGTYDFTSAIYSAFQDERRNRTTWTMTKTSTAPSVVITAYQAMEISELREDPRFIYVTVSQLLL